MAEQVNPQITDEDLLAYGKGVKVEVRNGEIIEYPMSPNRAQHGAYNSNLIMFLGMFVKARSLGRVFTEGTAFNLEQDSEGGIKGSVAPDVSFVSYQRIPIDASLDLIPRVAPDLAVEMVSPSDSLVDMFDKAHYYLDHGTSLVWLVIPRRREVLVYSASHPNGVTLTVDDDLAGEGLLAGFSIPVRAIFEENNDLHVEVLRRLMGG